MKTFLSICGLSLLFSFTLQWYAQWKIIPANAKVKFFVKEGKGYEEGVFTGVKGDIDFDPAQLDKSSINAFIDVKTINTGIDMRDESLRSKDFFETDTYPTLCYKATHVTKTDTGFLAHGSLSIKKATLPVLLPFTFTPTDSGAVFKGSFTIDRYKWGVGTKDDGVGNIVRVEMEIPVGKRD
jgi:polyisoprenoid-binding protein YceI